MKSPWKPKPKRANFKTHCKNGHPMTPENTLICTQKSYKGYRILHRRCKSCRRVTDRAKYARERDQHLVVPVCLPVEWSPNL